jgi:hypothetical protein
VYSPLHNYLVIRSAIINGKIDEAIRLMDMYFPGVLQEEGRGQELQLGLKCGRFVEMMRGYCEDNKNRRLRANSVARNGVTRSRSSSNSDLHLDTEEDNRKRANSASVASPTHSSFDSPIPTMVGGPPNKGRRLSYAAIAASLSPSSNTEMPKSNNHYDADMMDIDDVYPTNNKDNNTWARRTSIPNATTNGSLTTGEEENGNSSEAADTLKLVMQYGQSLQEEYRHDTREKTRSSLVVRLPIYCKFVETSRNLTFPLY